MHGRDRKWYEKVFGTTLSNWNNLAEAIQGRWSTTRFTDKHMRGEAKEEMKASTNVTDDTNVHIFRKKLL